MSDTVTPASLSDGREIVKLPLDSLAMAISYTGLDATAFTVVYQSITYIQTLTYDGDGNVINISQWIPQS